MVKPEMSEPESPLSQCSTKSPVNDCRIRSLLDDLSPSAVPVVTSSSSSSSYFSFPPPHFNGTYEKRLHVGNIPFKWREQELRQIFAPFGETRHVEVVTNEKGSKGYGFVTFSNGVAADRAMAGLSGRRFLGRTILVNEATNRRQHHSVSSDRPRGAGTVWNTPNLSTEQYSSDFGALLLQQKQLLAQQQLQQFLQTQQQTDLIAAALGLPTSNLSHLLTGSLQYPLPAMPTLTIDPRTSLQLQQLQSLPMLQHALKATVLPSHQQLPTVPSGYASFDATTGGFEQINQLPSMSSEKTGSSSATIKRRSTPHRDNVSSSTQRFTPY